MTIGIHDKDLVRSNPAFLLSVRHTEMGQVLAKVLETIHHPGGVPRLGGGLRFWTRDVLRPAQNRRRRGAPFDHAYLLAGHVR
jgi:hypothetical protein